MSQDRILLSGLVFYGHHGCAPAEQELGQRFVVDVELCADLSVPGKADQLHHTIDYAQVYADVQKIVEGKRHNLLEAVAEDIAQTLLAGYPVEAVRVCVKKPQPPVTGVVDFLGVEIVRDRQSYVKE